MQEDRELLVIGGSYLKVFVINGKYKLYGQSHIIFHHLKPWRSIAEDGCEQPRKLCFQVPLPEYLRAPYISLTIKGKIGKGFMWFWYALNGLALYPVDEYWEKMTLLERLDAWPHIKAYLPGMFKWYYDNLFTAVTPTKDPSLTSILDDIADTIPRDLQFPRNNAVSLFNIGYNIVTSLPFPILGDLEFLEVVKGQTETEKPDLEDNTIVVVYFDSLPPLIYRVVTGVEGWMTESAAADAMRNLGEENDEKEYFTLLPSRDEKLKTVNLLIRVRGRWYLYTEEDSRILPVKRFAAYRGTLGERKEARTICQSVSRDYIDHIYYPIGVGDVVLHGDLLVMRKRSQLVANIDIRALEKRTSITFLEDKRGILPLILPIWEWINGRDTCALPTPESWVLINYFGIPLDSEFIEQYIYDLFTKAQRGWDRGLYLQLTGILDSIPKAYLPMYRVMEEKETLYRTHGVPLRAGTITLADEILSTIWVQGDKIYSSKYKGYTQVTDGKVEPFVDTVVIWYLEGSQHKIFPIFVRLFLVYPGTSPAFDIQIKFEGGGWHAFRGGLAIRSVITIIRPPRTV